MKTLFAFIYIALTKLALAGMPPLVLSKSISPAIVYPGDTVTVCMTVQAPSGTPQADIYWVIDTTGSMGSIIDDVASNITSFTSQLASQGIDYRNGLFDYKDEYYDAVPYTNYGFAASDAQFLGWINGLVAGGGGDAPESGLEALTMSAAAPGWRPSASHTLILVTDINVHAANYDPPKGSLFLSSTAQSLRNAGFMIHSISPSPSYGPLSDASYLTVTSGGLWFNVYSASWNGLISSLAATVASYTNVVIQDPVPPQLIPIPGQYGGATLSAGTLTWTVSQLGQGSALTRCFLSTVAAGFSGAITNTACVAADAVSATCQAAVPVFYVTPSPSFTISPTFTPSPSITPTFSVTPSPTATPRPLLLQLLPPNPNPSPGPDIWLPFYLDADAYVNIKIYSLAGELVTELPRRWMLQGFNEIQWKLDNAAGKPVSSGVYIYKLEARSLRDEFKSDFAKCAVAR